MPQKTWKLLTQIDQYKGQWLSGAKLSTQVLGRLKKSVLVTSTGASTRIEGAKLSDEDIERLLKGLSIQTFSDRDKQEVRGYYELLDNLFNSWKTISLSESTIKFFHKEILKYVDKDKIHRGEYKKRENKVHMINQVGESIGVLFDTTPAYLTSKEMIELLDWTTLAFQTQEHHPLIIIGNFLVEFLNIHPFQDGNGRLSRVLTNLLLLKQNYLFAPYVSHEKLIEDNKPDYYVALRKSQKTMKKKKENIEPWLEFFLTIILKQSQIAIALLSDENIDKLLSPKQMAVWNYLKEAKKASPLEISKKVNIARPTVNQVMDKLLSYNKVERLGLGRATRYRIKN
ncbi:Fic family protein [bacterium]|nr:Fic family protein [bacterium]